MRESDGSCARGMEGEKAREKEMLRDGLRPTADQAAREVGGRQRCKATNEANKTHGQAASGSHGSLFS